MKAELSVKEDGITGAKNQKMIDLITGSIVKFKYEGYLNGLIDLTQEYVITH